MQWLSAKAADRGASGLVLVADNHKCSFTENIKIPDKLAVTPLKQCLGFLFSKFISHMIVTAPAEIAYGTPVSCFHSLPLLCVCFQTQLCHWWL